jgi:hypothetical protein
VKTSNLKINDEFWKVIQLREIASKAMEGSMFMKNNMHEIVTGGDKHIS